jgi:hypothetical protein
LLIADWNLFCTFGWAFYSSPCLRASSQISSSSFSCKSFVLWPQSHFLPLSWSPWHYDLSCVISTTKKIHTNPCSDFQNKEESCR